MFKKTPLIIALSLLMACVGTKKKVGNKIDKIYTEPFYENHFTGLVVFDPVSKDTLFNHNGKKYFTPASNVKIFTLFTAIELLPNAMPALKYRFENDTTFIEGTGDPTLLHPYFKDSTALQFMKSRNHIALFLDNFNDDNYGPGWAWEDYGYHFQPEKNSFPIYGNVATLCNCNLSNIEPAIFKDSVISKKYGFNRALDKNLFHFDATRTDTIEVPFKTSKALTKRLFEEKLGKTVTLTTKKPTAPMQVVYSVPLDSVYVRMMRVSDNFLAEQLLIVAATTLSDTLSGSITINHILKNQLANLRQTPRWVDGSGLSRYNLFTPESMVGVLHNMYLKVETQRLLHFFDNDGLMRSATERHLPSAQAYIFAKSGSFGNTYNSSGYLRTKSGKILIFSSMNNHFTQPTTAVKIKLKQTLDYFYESF